jgi:uracil-DNA glycosylase
MDTITYRTILFLGSNPSKSSISTLPFWEDSRSRKILDSWLNKIQLDQSCSIRFMNVSDSPTENNRPLKMKEIRLESNRLNNLIKEIKPIKIVALGKTAEIALTMLQLPHLTMPHPSGKNFQLNDKKFVEEKIKRLGEYLALS